MNLQHIIVVNNRVHEVRRATDRVITFGHGRQFGMLFLASGKVVTKHVLNGKFRGERVKPAK